MFWQTLGWFGSWLGVIGCGVWACLEVLVKALAVAWLYRQFRDGEREEEQPTGVCDGEDDRTEVPERERAVER